MPLVMIVVVAIAAGGLWYYYTSLPTTPRAGSPLVSTLHNVQPLSQATPNEVSSPAPPRTAGTPLTFNGSVLAGTTSPLLDFNQADFEAAKASDKLIVLYFYANWCPICREEFPLMQAAFNQLQNSNVVGFRVNYNDDETDDFEKNLAREHGVAYQHTKVFVRGGQQVLKSPESWEQARYLTEITNAAR